MQNRRDIEKAVRQEESDLKGILSLLALSGDSEEQSVPVPPEHWPEPLKAVFAVAVYPNMGRLNREYGKGIRVLSLTRMLLSGTAGRFMTIDEIPEWIVSMSREHDKDPGIRRSAERVRSDLPGIIWKLIHHHAYQI